MLKYRIPQIVTLTRNAVRQMAGKLLGISLSCFKQMAR